MQLGVTLIDYLFKNEAMLDKLHFPFVHDQFEKLMEVLPRKYLNDIREMQRLYSEEGFTLREIMDMPILPIHKKSVG
ncbi:MAG: hypothetical protein F4X16_12455 [Caldilineaceae bacterium SB0661_bin_34]|nr:hypothetical protein [Caldilineaceae bacterium SB0661_bin_34]